MFYIDKCIINMESTDELKEIDIANCTCHISEAEFWF